tara:strand:+ start:1584 stop:2249 length:666 start_codon:yes stop_codon:yes gene_type:complete
MTAPIELSVISKSLNDDCLSHIYSFVNTRQLCFEVLKKRKDTNITNHILRPTMKRFTEGKYYIDIDYAGLGNVVFRVKKLTKCFITIEYYMNFIKNPNHFYTIKKKRFVDYQDYEWCQFTKLTSFNMRKLVEVNKLPLYYSILWKNFEYVDIKHSNNKFVEKVLVGNLLTSPKEMKGDFDWLLIDLRKQQIKDYEDKSVINTEAIQQLKDLNTQQLLLETN